MLKIYGSMLCADCVECKEQLTAANVEFEFHDFADELSALKEFLVLRDSQTVFESVKEAGKIGIPCIVTEDGKIVLDWNEFLLQN